MPGGKTKSEQITALKNVLAYCSFIEWFDEYALVRKLLAVTHPCCQCGSLRVQYGHAVSTLR